MTITFEDLTIDQVAELVDYYTQRFAAGHAVAVVSKKRKSKRKKCKQPRS